MFIDSHCHLDRIDLVPYQNDFKLFMQEAENSKIDQMLCIAIDLESYPNMVDLVKDYPSISLSVGVHPNVQEGKDPSVEELIALGKNPKVIAIGETGLDYFRSEGDLEWQHQRFRNHIQAAKKLSKPLIIHTREAGHDSLDDLASEGADEVGGIIHCFTEDWDYAKKALDLGFYISFSGIVTFKNAQQIKEVAKKIPADRFLIETDSPYLAPVPFRGKRNESAHIYIIAQRLADIFNVSINEIAEITTKNADEIFKRVN